MGWCVAALDSQVAQSAGELDRAAGAFAGARVTARSVHRLRRSLRRLDALVKAYRPLIGKPGAQALRELIRPVRAGAGACRDCDVGLKLLSALEAEGRGCPGLKNWLRARRRSAASLLKDLDAHRAGERLRDEWLRTRAGLTADPKNRSAGSFARGRIVRGIKKARKRIGPAMEWASGSATLAGLRGVDRVHELRLRLKVLRHWVESLGAAVSGSSAGRLTKSLDRAQDELGKGVDAWRLVEFADRFERERAGGPDGREGREWAAFHRFVSSAALRHAGRGVSRSVRAIKKAERLI